jgi:S-DNA-T family DNA segregation ATPase FtsK/SpoIIIE
MNEQFWMGWVEKLNIGTPGGLMGEVLAQRSLGFWIGHAGAGIVFFVLLFIAVVRMLDLRIVDLGKWIWAKVKSVKFEKPSAEEVFEEKRAEAPAPKRKIKRKTAKPKTTAEPKVKTAEKQDSPVDIKALVEAQQKITDKKEVTKPKVELNLPPVKKGTKAKVDEGEDGAFTGTLDTETRVYKLPPLSLLDAAVPQSKGMSASEVADTAQILQDTLEEFGVEAKVTGVQQGPVVTCYEILPAAGVRVERIKALSDNIALKMHAESIRIQAPIPGKGVCGVEVPNTSRQSVFFRDMIESPQFRN